MKGIFKFAKIRIYEFKKIERPIQLQQEVFKKLFEAANIASLNGLNIKEMYTERDRLGQLAYARREGKAEGLLEGEARGKAEEKQRILDILYSNGLLTEDISNLLCKPD